MPMSPPYNNMILLSTGGSKQNNAGFNTPAEDGAWAISVSGRREGLRKALLLGQPPAAHYLKDASKAAAPTSCPAPANHY